MKATSASNQEVIPEKELSCDVLVVGTGFAGLVATLRALEKKANVLTIEKLPRGWWTPGGNLIISGGQVHLAMISMNTPEPQLRQALLDVTGNMIPRDLLDVTVKHSARALKWAMDNGVEFMETPGKEKKLKPAIPPPIWGRVKPGGVHDAAKYGNKKAANELEDRIYKKGGKILFETKALKLRTNVKNEVIGLVAQDKDGKFNINAKNVILCTGGYERNADMLVKYVGPHADEIVIYCGPGCTGDGFKMGEELGVALRSMNNLAFSHYYSADCYWKEDLQGIWLEDVGYEGILVNVDGNRFANEALGERTIGSIITKTNIFLKNWIVIDSAIYSKKEIEEKIAPLKEFGGTIHTANTIEELAKKAGIGPRLAITVNDFNKAAAAGKAAELPIPKTDAVNQIVKPPFYAIPFVPGIPATYGGFLVSPKAEVLNLDKKPIKGLYAAGLLMEGSLSGGVENKVGAYVGCLGACLVFGLLAAENATA